MRFRSHTELQSQAPPPDTDTFLKRKCTNSITVCQNNVTPYSSSRTRTACLARGSKNYLPVRPPNLLKRKKTHPSTVPNQNLIRRIQPVQRRKKKKVHFSQTTCTLQELSVSQINGKGEKFCISLCQPSPWRLHPSRHVPTLSQANIHTQATTRCATSEKRASWKLTYQKKLFFFFFPKLTLCADLLLGHTAEERVAGVREAPNHSGSSCRRTAAWTNCQPTLQRERYTANKSVTLSVIPVYIESNRSLSLGSSHHGYIGTARGTISQASSQTSLSLGWSLFD